jgi:hypothetical protein
MPDNTDTEGKCSSVHKSQKQIIKCVYVCVQLMNIEEELLQFISV